MFARPFACALALFAALPATAEPFRLIVTSAEPALVPNSILHLAESEGFYDRAGVDVELVPVQQTPSAVAALRAGEGDMANISTEALLQVVARDQMDLRAVTSPDRAIPFLIAAQEEVGSLPDLAGASFGINRPGSLDHSLSAKVLAAHEVAPDAVELVALGRPAVRAQALAADRVDATTISIGTWLSLPDRSGLHVLVAPDDFFAAAPLVSKVNAVRVETLEERPEDVQAVIAALTRAARHYNDNPRDWVEAMAEARPDLERADLEELADHFSGSWSVNGGLDAADLGETAEFIFSGEDFAGLAQPDLSEWVAFAPVDAVLDDLGVRADGDPAGR